MLVIDKSTYGFKKDEETGEVIYRDGKRVQYNAMVNRLVCSAFKPNPNNLPEVNHLSEDKLNNDISNLDWVDRETNINHGTRTARQRAYSNNMTATHRQNLSNSAKNRPKQDVYVKNRKLILEKDGEVIEYPNVKAAAKELGLNPSLLHYKAKHGKRYNGYSVKKVY